MVKNLILILVSLVLTVVIGSTSSNHRNDGIVGISLVIGLLTSFVLGKASFSPTVFLCCGLILGFSIAAGLSSSDNSIVIFFSIWAIYTALFFAVGKRSSVSTVSPQTNFQQQHLPIAMKQFSNDPNYGAVERVYAYIVDACEWEKQAIPRNPKLESELQSHVKSRLAGKAPGRADSTVLKLVQERGRALLSSRSDQLQSLQRLAEIHWIGESWRDEMLLLSNPPKHDPKVELIIDLHSNDDGSADVTTQTDAEQRVYRVEYANGKWLIRKYDWQPKP